MEAAVLKLYGDIGESVPMDVFFEGAETISSKTVSQFIDDNKQASEIIVRINSRGGDVQEGWAIYDLLVNSGKKVRTVGEGRVYSIATVIFLAGSEREMMKNADGLIHNPFIPPYTLADQYESGDLEKIAESLKQEEAKILNFYVERTGSPAEKLAEYMKEDTKLSAEDMLSLGFATKVIEPVKAYAYMNFKNDIIMKEADVKTFGEKLDTILDKIKNFSRLSSMDQTLKDKDGKEFKLDKESGSPAVGDKASPDGSYPMDDGRTIVVSGGVIASIDEAEQAKSDLELANEKIAELENLLATEKTKIADSEKEKADLVVAEQAFKSKEAEAVALYTELTNMKNSWVPETRGKFSAGEKVGDINMNRVRELKEKMKNNAKTE